MKLELTVTKDIIKNRFNIDTKYDNCRQRLKDHVLISSDELYDLWEKDAREHGYINEFTSWFFTFSNSYARFRKLKMADLESIDGTANEPEKIVVATAKSSSDKIIIGDVNLNLRKNTDIRFISEKIFMKDKIQTITMSDIKNVLERNRNEKLFDIYETPIRVEVQKDSDANLLSQYLSTFIKDSKTITIKDAYLKNHANERNLKNYILPHLDLENCKIIIGMTWDERGKKQYEQKFRRYLGSDAKIISVKQGDEHSSYIKTDKYIIDLGYRLQIFGFEDDGLTEAETINISRVE